MYQNRRAVLASVLAVLGVAAIFASCAEDATAPSEITLQDVGRLHNEGLAHVFVRLTNAEREGSGLSAEQLNQVVDDALREFFTTAGFEGISLESITAQMTNSREFVLSRPDYSVEAVQTVSNYGLAAAALSEAAVPYLQAVFDAVRTYSAPTNDLRATLASIEQQARMQLREQDLQLLLGASAVAISSAEYWHEHYSEWRALCTRNPGACGPDAQDISAATMPALSATASECGWAVLGADVLGFAIGKGIKAKMILALLFSTYVAFVTC